jgi:hypothetical protein
MVTYVSVLTISDKGIKERKIINMEYEIEDAINFKMRMLVMSLLFPKGFLETSLIR